MQVDHGDQNLYLSVGSFLASVAGFFAAHFTKADIAWAIGCAAGVVSIAAGVLTVNEKVRSIKRLKRQEQAEEAAKK